MTDQIELAGISAFGYHGVLPQERATGQTFVVDAVLSTDIAAAAAADDLTLTVDYAQVAAAIVADVARDPVDLIETLAQRLATTCLGFAGVTAVRITVHKPQAPVGVPFRDIAVRIERSRSSLR